MGPGDRIEFANSLRGLAALMVVVAHLLGTFWVSQPVVAWMTGLPALTVDPPALVRWVQAVPVNFAGLGVGLFFLISGFVIPFSLVRYDAPAFLVGRVLRIHPTYAAGLALTVLAVLVGTWFGGTVPFKAKEVVAQLLSPMRALMNWRPIDGIVWTLEVELFFYALCAFLVRPMRRGDTRVFLVPVGLMLAWAGLMTVFGAIEAASPALAYRLVVLAYCAPFLAFMFCGVALNFRQRGLLTRTQTGAAVLAAFALHCLALISARTAPLFDWISYAAALALFVLAMRSQEWFAQNRVFQVLANISYPLYVVHGVQGYVLLQLLLMGGVLPSLALAIVLPAVFVTAYGVHRFVEVPTHRLGQRLARTAMARRLRRPALAEAVA